MANNQRIICHSWFLGLFLTMASALVLLTAHQLPAKEKSEPDKKISKIASIKINWKDCEETVDPGNSLDVKGTVRATAEGGRRIIFNDVCATTTKVRQFFCDGNAPKSDVANCPAGRECANNSGVCASRGNTWIACTDNDPDNRLNVKGVTTAFERNRFGRTRSYMLEDVCSGENRVRQYYCAGNTPVSTEIDGCLGTDRCENGACLESAEIDMPIYTCLSDIEYGLWSSIDDAYNGPYYCGMDLSFPDDVMEDINPRCDGILASENKRPCRCEEGFYCRGSSASVTPEYVAEDCRYDRFISPSSYHTCGR